ncbi:hypothetical protein ACWGE0_34600 [Lentzea sp. NPDC054927]
MKLQRDQVVAATLVGTVVVLLGFASGIGRVPQAQNTVSQPNTHVPSTATTTRPEQPRPPANNVPQPVAHNPVPAPHLPAGPYVPAPEHPHPSTPPGTTPPPTTRPPTTTPNEPCDAGAITKLLRQLGLLSLLDELPVVPELPEGTKKAEELPVVDLPLLGGLGDVGKLLDGLLGSTCALVVDEKTDKVTALLDTP